MRITHLAPMRCLMSPHSPLPRREGPGVGNPTVPAHSPHPGERAILYY